ncbi:P-loop containing nucleoside triphosphate hydrolase protein [Suhomyces tanzawaensis NRRL Y-17324]|uniref:Signal recognition particle receptor subunit alpha homolog n=1 Tax=Suhomyces tanzawaensis NRRL Y-17324 TaxID=984487 RepID=A0A1E4SGV2_9ASCO|nr:P-loop containing nucleoside triphosphate hydrolase protein [Suhomyces tanzawaensis NRRL Y-17324]ODV78716.1 P-loop containing nucleoside triphosphate hydrolase protein [Suhomyces tanzawaensis NRRL Y-17324]
MSQSLIIFRSSGKIEYQYNTKTNPFNEFIYTLVNETSIELDANFYTASLHQKRFYCYKRESVYAALYFDAVTTLDGDKVKSTLQGILKTYNKLHEDEDEDVDKLKKLVELQFNKLMKIKLAEPTKPRSATPSGASTPIRKPGTPVPKTPLSNKKMRKWDGDQISSALGNSKTLDYSAADDSSHAVGDTSQYLADDSAFVKENELVLVNELNDILGESDDEEEEAETSSKKGFLGKLTSYFGSNIDVNEVSKKFQDQLVSKNIAPSTAKTIIEKIQNNFSSKKNVTMPMYKQALTDELTKILTPNVSTDLLYDIKRNSGSSNRAYVISVVGVNGVGKSTNLAKLAFWFLQNNMSVLICACDTFRSGAVEQLKVHVNNLKNLTSSDASSKIDIFEKGYGSGDHVVATAKLAIQHATEQQYDIVLIDTAGRTHSNAKLMAPLKKFGDAANPDKIIMVGEALVGTDSVEQAINFNNAFGNRRSLDFFIISKVDTVGDLVGTMINMVMATKVPILFVGTGQTYTDIKRLSVNRVVEMLMS